MPDVSGAIRFAAACCGAMRTVAVTAFPCALCEEAYVLDHAPDARMNKVPRLPQTEIVVHGYSAL
jgi:hypothetical protein